MKPDAKPTTEMTLLMLDLAGVAGLLVKKLICCRFDDRVFRSLATQAAGAVRAVLAQPEFENIPEPPEGA